MKRKRQIRWPFVALLSLAVVAVAAVIMLARTPSESYDELPVFDASPAPAASPSYAQPPAAGSAFLPGPSQTPSEEPSPFSPEPITAQPIRIIIPAIEVDSEMVGTERDEKANSMAVYPSASVISWYKQRSIPGNEGNAILGGHNKWKGEKGAIAELGKLQIGDEMTIEYEDGSKRSFMLESIFEYELKAAPSSEIMRADGPARVTIITCSGKFNTAMGTSENRLVAIFRPAEVFVTPDPPVTPFPANN